MRMSGCRYSQPQRSSRRSPGWITAIPMVFMFGVSSWALTAILVSAVKSGEMIRLCSSAFLLALAAALIVIAALKARRPRATV